MNATAPDIALSEPGSLSKLRRRELFVTKGLSGVWQVAVSEYLPLVGTILHDSASFPQAIEENCLLSSSTRRYKGTSSS